MSELSEILGYRPSDYLADPELWLRSTPRGPSRVFAAWIEAIRTRPVPCRVPGREARRFRGLGPRSFTAGARGRRGATLLAGSAGHHRGARDRSVAAPDRSAIPGLGRAPAGHRLSGRVRRGEGEPVREPERRGRPRTSGRRVRVRHILWARLLPRTTPSGRARLGNADGRPERDGRSSTGTRTPTATTSSSATRPAW